MNDPSALPGPAAAWLSNLVRIPSVSPDHAGPRSLEPGEARIAVWAAERCEALGARCELEEVSPGRPNLYALWPGRGGPFMALDVHLDTVGVEQMAGDPFSGEIRDGRVWGRGASDTKASLGVALAVLQEMQSRGQTPCGDLLLLATVDEEYGGTGAPAAARWLERQGLKPDEMLVAEPTGCTPVIAHRGVLRLSWAIQGEATHTAQPHLGKNAIHAAGLIITALAAESERLCALSSSGEPGDEPPSLSVTMISGGRAPNVVPDECRIIVDRRIACREEGEAVESELQELVSRASKLPLSTEQIKLIQPFLRRASDPWSRKLVELTGREPAGAPYCTNAWAYSSAASGLAVLGPGSIDQAHGALEWIEISALEELARIYRAWWRPA